MSEWVLRICQAVDQFLGDSRRSRAVTRIAHARLLAIALGIRDQPEELDRLMSEWERHTFRVFGLCRRDARTHVGAYVRLAWDIYNRNLSGDEISARLRTEIGSEEHELSIEWAIENVQSSNCYEAWEDELRFLIYRYEEHLAASKGIPLAEDQWARIWESSPSNSIEHIQPQSKSGSLKRSLHHLGNLVLVSLGLNSKLGNLKPEAKVAAYRSTGLLTAAEAADLIESQGWNHATVKERESRIITWIRETWA